MAPSRGIRQGDPLSLYLFILCTEVLSAMCNQAQLSGALQGVKVSRGSPAVNHLLFADDTMFFCRSNPSCVNTLKNILNKYADISGQCINLGKSAVTFSAKTPPEVKLRVKATLGIDAEGGIGKYLGLPELFGRKKRDIFAAILNRIRQRIQSWTTRFLSGAGKQVLLKAVLAAMPCYSMSCFKLPASLCKQIQSLHTRFWWDANPEKRKMCWVAWSTLTKPKFAGGLGFRDLQSFNDALLAKIGWRLIKEPSSLLAQVLLGKYAKDSSFMECSVSASASHGWRSILEGREILRKGLGWAVGDGEKIKLWTDPWLSFEAPVAPIGPCSEAASVLRVSDLLCPISNTWDVMKIRSYLPHYEEKILSIITSTTSVEDTLVWLFEKSGVYSTRSGYRVAVTWEQERISPDPNFDWVKHLWNVKTSPKLKDFLWRVVSKAIPVSANLERRGLPPFCCKRCGGIEDDLHTFLLCPFANSVWDLAPLTERPDASLPSLALLLSLGNKSINLPPVGIHIPLWPWILWNLWKAHNKLIFDDRSFSASEVVLKSIKDAKEWQEAQLKDGCLLNESTRPPRRNSSTQNVSGLICNVDAAWSQETGDCGVGGIFKGPGSASLPTINLSRRFVNSALTAEALAVRSAVLLAVSSNIQNLTIMSDSQVIISLLKAKESRPALYGIISDIYHLFRLFESLSFMYVPRLENVEADTVAKSALFCLNNPPIRE